MLKLKLRLKLVLSLGLIFIAGVAFGESFDLSIKSLSKQFSNKEYQTIFTRLTALKPTKELEDIYYYLKAESLKGLKRNTEAISAYEELYNKFPKSEASKHALFTVFLLKLEEANEHSLMGLEALTSKLSSWQSGNAFEKLHNLSFVKKGKKSRYALQSLRSYSKGQVFYRQFASTHGLLKKIWASPENYEFIEKEWIEILDLTSNENLLGSVFNNSNTLKYISNRLTKLKLEFYRAKWLSGQKKFQEATKIYDALLNNKQTPKLLGLKAKLERGNCHHFSNKNWPAISDYKDVINSKEPGLDVLEAEYRLVKTYFKIKRDSEAIEGIRGLIKGKRMGWLVPTNLYDMGLECYDGGEFKRAQEYFKIFLEYYIGHHRAQAALGYGAKAAGKSDNYGFKKRLTEKYTNSFFVWWLDSRVAELPVKHKEAKMTGLKADVNKKLTRFKKLWNTEFEKFVQAEANLLTETHGRNFNVFKSLMDLAWEREDYKSLCGYGERLARQLLEAGRSLDEMPLWAWKGMYPLAFEKEVRANAQKFGVDPYWIWAIMREESHFQKDIKSRSNAMSLMQILPSTGGWIAGRLGERGFKVSQLWDIKVNIRYGAWYLRYLSDLFNEDMILASAAYNGGQGNITRKVQAIYGHLPVLDRIDKVPMTETRDYYKKVMSSYFMYRRIYEN